MMCNLRRGLSLLELVTVIAILAVLAGIVLPQLSGVSTQSTDTVTKYGLQQVRDVILNRYAVDMTGLVFANASPAVVNQGLPVPDPALTSGSRNPYTPQLIFLFVNQSGTQTPVAPSTVLGWRGPYLGAGTGRFPAATDRMANESTATANGFYSGSGSVYGIEGDPTVLDGWGNPIVVRVYDPTPGRNDTNPPPPLSHLFTLEPLSAGAPAMTLSNAVLVSAGPDGILTDSAGSTTDNVTLKVQ